MMPPLKRQTFFKILLGGLLTVALAGCLPVPMFEVTPTPARAGTELTFDASTSVVANVPENNVAVGWSWSFGDGSSAKGETATHTYEKAGTYTIKLTVTDSAGRSASIEEPLVVKEALATTTGTSDETSSSSSSTTTASQ